MSYMDYPERVVQSATLVGGTLAYRVWSVLLDCGHKIEKHPSYRPVCPKRVHCRQCGLVDA